jgi:hypothetical protein
VPGFVVELNNCCAGIVVVLFWLAINPVVPGVAVAVQLKVAPLTAELNVTKAELVPEHIVCGPGAIVTSGVGLTVISTVIGVPAHPTPLV